MDKFKEVVEDVSGGKIAATVQGEPRARNGSRLIGEAGNERCIHAGASPGFMTAIGVPEVDIYSLEYLFDSFDHWEKCLDGEFGDKMKDVVKEKTNNNFRIMKHWRAPPFVITMVKPVTKPEDLKENDNRTLSSQVQQDFWTCGAIHLSVIRELYQALQQGVVELRENDYTSFILKEHHKTPNATTSLKHIMTTQPNCY